jgi:hypothetical protein
MRQIALTELDKLESGVLKKGRYLAGVRAKLSNGESPSMKRKQKIGNIPQSMGEEGTPCPRNIIMSW